MVSAGVEVPGADRREPTMTLTGWRRFVDSAPAGFDLLAGEQWQALSGELRGRYDGARINYHSELVVVATSTVREVARQGRLLTLLNRREISARRGLIVSGPQTTGKNTALKQLGRTHELMVRERHPGADRIPVVYVTTPPKGSPRKLAMEFARFLGLPPVRRGQNTTDIADAVCQVLIDARVDLVLVDEIHNLNLATSAGEDMSDHLKYFTGTCRPRLPSPGSTWSAPDCSPECAASRSLAGSCWPPPARSPASRNGRAWWPPWRPRCGCTATSPARCPS